MRTLLLQGQFAACSENLTSIPAPPAYPHPSQMGLLDRLKPSAPTRPAAPFVVGMNRSGTTLLRMMLDAHPDITLPPETHFVPTVIKAMKEEGAGTVTALEAMKSHREWGDFDFSDDDVWSWAGGEKTDAGTVLRGFYEAYAERQGKPRWGEKTPMYVTKMRMIERAIPEARFVHVIRDGRDVALSVLDRTVRDLTAAHVAGRWKRKIERAQSMAPKLQHYLEIRYEDLILDTEPTLRKITDFADLEWEPEMLSYHERSADRLQEMARALPSTEGGAKELTVERRMATHEMTTKAPDADRVSRWRRQMSEEDRVAFEEVAGDLLERLGYPVGEPVDAA